MRYSVHEKALQWPAEGGGGGGWECTPSAERSIVQSAETQAEGRAGVSTATRHPTGKRKGVPFRS